MKEYIERAAVVEDDTKPTFLVSCWEIEKGTKDIGNWATDEWLKMRFGEKIRWPRWQEEVTFCKDCRYYQDAKANEKGFLICPASGMEITETDFCSYGQRKIETVLTKSDAKDESLEETHANTRKTHADAIENARVQSEEANMDKPLEDWTLGEVNEMCKKRDSCRKCIFQNKHDKDCKIRTHPTNLDLSEKPRFTEQEVEDAKNIKRLIDSDFYIVKRDGGLALIDRDEKMHRTIWLNDKAFPSLKDGQTVTLDEIIGGADHA